MAKAPFVTNEMLYKNSTSSWPPYPGVRESIALTTKAAVHLAVGVGGPRGVGALAPFGHSIGGAMFYALNLLKTKKLKQKILDCAFPVPHSG